MRLTRLACSGLDWTRACCVSLHGLPSPRFVEAGVTRNPRLKPTHRTGVLPARNRNRGAGMGSPFRQDSARNQARNHESTPVA